MATDTPGRMSSTEILRAICTPFQQDRLLHILLVLALILTVFQPDAIRHFPQWVNWTTIMTLAGLMLLTKGIESSGYLDHAGRHILSRLRHERPLAIFLVTAAALLSTVLTNDIALFIVVPLTLGLRNVAALPVSRLIIFEALAVNAGSLLTPIGNPQNILLWQQSHLSFAAFTLQMLPLAAAVFGVLLLLTLLAFPNQAIAVRLNTDGATWDTRQLAICAVLYVGFVLALEFGHAGPGLIAVVACLLLLYRRLLITVDWSLMLVFILMFIDIRLLTGLSFLTPALDAIAAYSDLQILWAGLLGSQLISNVPATILLLKYLPASKVIAYAVNAGGFGLVLGSLANLIALRMASERKIWVQFHFYSIPLLVISGALAYFLLDFGPWW